MCAAPGAGCARHISAAISINAFHVFACIVPSLSHAHCSPPAKCAKMSQNDRPSAEAIAAARVALGKSRGRPSDLLLEKARELERSGNIKPAKQLNYEENDDMDAPPGSNGHPRSTKRLRKSMITTANQQIPLSVSRLLQHTSSIHQ